MVHAISRSGSNVRDEDRHVVAAHRKIVERPLAIHVDDELVPTLVAGTPVESINMPELSMVDPPLGIAEQREDASPGSAGIMRPIKALHLVVRCR